MMTIHRKDEDPKRNRNYFQVYIFKKSDRPMDQINKFKTGPKMQVFRRYKTTRLLLHLIIS